MNKWIFRLLILVMFIGLFIVFELSQYTTVVLFQGIGLILISCIAILWYGTPKGKIKGHKNRNNN